VAEFFEREAGPPLYGADELSVIRYVGLRCPWQITPFTDFSVRGGLHALLAYLFRFRHLRLTLSLVFVHQGG
jgi:hypothetical protein